MANFELKQLCRICLRSPEDELIQFNNADAIVDELAPNIELFGGIKLQIAENAPDSICLKCLMMLKIAVKFRQLCQDSQQRLLKMLEIDVEETTMTKRALQTEVFEDEQFAIEVAGAADEEQNLQMDIKPFSLSCEYLENEDSIYAESAQLNDDDDDGVFEDVEDIVLSNMQQSLDEYADDAAETETYEILDSDTAPSTPEVDSINVQAEHGEVTQVECSVDSEKEVKQTATANLYNFKHLLMQTKQTKGKKAAAVNIKKEHICNICGNVYRVKAKLTLHMKVHNQHKPHHCEICGKNFAQTPQLARHMNTHTGNRPFKCKYCTSSFADPSTCIKHERIHTNVKPFKCEICGKAFGYSNVLKVHMMTHSGEKPHSCQVCGKCFTQAHHMRAHLRTHYHEIK